jgi:diaminopimelate epimerase
MTKFSKAHAYGNDFVYVDSREVDGVGLEELARQLCERHSGVGADGLIVFERTVDGASMRLFNADGSRAEVSGNGVRGLGALLLLDDGRVDSRVTIHTEAGQKQLDRISCSGSRQVFRAAMGNPTELRETMIAVESESLKAVILNLGNPHCVILGPLPNAYHFQRRGSALEQHPLFGSRTNVEFADVERPDLVRILIWERGVGPTMSSGTGSCAALVAAAAFGGAAREADVVAPGGAQRVEWRDDNVYLTGWAEVLFHGDWLP